MFREFHRISTNGFKILYQTPICHVGYKKMSEKKTDDLEPLKTFYRSEPLKHFSKKKTSILKNSSNDLHRPAKV